MANKNLFLKFLSKRLPPADAVNEAGGRAYERTPEEKLLQYALTGCLNSTYYATDEEQLKAVLALVDNMSPSFIARVAIYARREGLMKDLPALLCAVLTVTDTELLKKVFPKVIDNGRMLRTFVQIVRSGVLPRRSFGTVTKRLIQNYLESRSAEELLNDSVGNTPSLKDIIKMVHPRPLSKEKEAVYGYLLGKEIDLAKLPEQFQAYEAFKKDSSGALPKVPFSFLSSLELSRKQWSQLVGQVPWQALRMNLNTFARHGVFELRNMGDVVARRLADEEAIRRSRVFPYQLMAAKCNLSPEVPKAVANGLEKAMEYALRNVPEIDGQIYICLDVSGSMSSPVTGRRGSATSKVTCVDVAALFASALLDKNADAVVLPFADEVKSVRVTAKNTVMGNAEKLRNALGGGTNCSAPLEKLNDEKARGDLIVFLSDNQSWMESLTSTRTMTETQRQWAIFKQRNPKARLVCIDLQPSGTTQAKSDTDILNIGGFSDHWFEVIAQFAKGDSEEINWMEKIESIKL